MSVPAREPAALVDVVREHLLAREDAHVVGHLRAVDAAFAEEDVEDPGLALALGELPQRGQDPVLALGDQHVVLQDVGVDSRGAQETAGDGERTAEVRGGAVEAPRAQPRRGSMPAAANRRRSSS